ncbi:hypothetical protein FD41_GL002849 [Lentilactobacillus farraginis DSM 18382 = JCM 14108]|uniref:Uncharacterized protein n=1 Tax=Lentilactobacillus farraginis DSM 18382 = JCM 14108 TaxID=1423743 RepID=X0PIH7_9LACO|nr:hypothetical protein FD41_GL002849 [Lentilactobacillus farraginis DSM 18382 = JCM 14108]GAF36927.1 hypothetical protein JCM14108_1924 [Lentilactobacillus farraginis DSM 18382 = JCM 14108]
MTAHLLTTITTFLANYPLPIENYLRLNLFHKIISYVIHKKIIFNIGILTSLNFHSKLHDIENK